MHHGAVMRLTANLDDDLYSMARAYSINERISISRSLNQLLRKRLSGSSEDSEARRKRSATPLLSKTGLKVSTGKPNLTEADVREAIANLD